MTNGNMTVDPRQYMTLDPGPASTPESEWALQPVPGPGGQIIGYMMGDHFLTVQQAQSLAATGTWPVDPGAGRAPPAYAGTQAGMQERGAIDLALQQSADAAAMARVRAGTASDMDIARLQESGALERLGITEAGLNKRQKKQLDNDWYINKLNQSEAWKRLQSQIGADKAIAEFEGNMRFREAVLSEVGAGTRTELQAAADFRRSYLGEAGAGARAEMGEFTARRGQSIGAVTDTFARLADLATTPSDFRRLAFNVEGIQPPGPTPTDQLRGGMQQFFGQQLEAAGQQGQSFADLFQQGQQGMPEAPSYADIYGDVSGAVTQGNVGYIKPKYRRLQFGGEADGSAVVGEKGPELVRGKFEVTPHLSRGEQRLLNTAGVKRAQFGYKTTGYEPTPTPTPTPTTQERYVSPFAAAKPQAQGAFGASAIPPQYLSRIQDTLQGAFGGRTGGAATPASPYTPPVAIPNPYMARIQDALARTFGTDRTLPGQPVSPYRTALPEPAPQFGVEEPFFTSIRQGQMPAFTPAAFNTPGITATGFQAPTLGNLQQWNAMLPFQKQMYMGAYGEEIRDPVTGEIRRAGFDPQSVYAAMRRFSPTGIMQGPTRYG